MPILDKTGVIDSPGVRLNGSIALVARFSSLVRPARARWGRIAGGVDDQCPDAVSWVALISGVPRASVLGCSSWRWLDDPCGVGR